MLFRCVPEFSPGGLLDPLEILVIALIELTQHFRNTPGFLTAFS